MNTRYLLLVCANAFAVPMNPITAEDLRINDRLMEKKYSKERLSGDPVDTVVLHYTSNVVANQKNPHDVDKIIAIFEKYGVSAHYLLDRDGTVYRLVDEKRQAFHAGKGEIKGKPERTNQLNRYSIGIELLGIGTYEEMKNYLTKEEYDAIPQEHKGFTKTQYMRLKLLLIDLSQRHKGIILDRSHVIGHSEYAEGRKSDPGELFEWRKIGL